MSEATVEIRRKIARRYRHCPIDSPRYTEKVIATLSDFFAVFHALLEPNKVFWFRGHPRVEYRLAPSALRFSNLEQRDTALGLISDMRRFLEMKLARPPLADDHLGWMQVAQHYGLPTRLLDWTQNAAVALFFACSKDFDADGLVAILNPTELNQSVDVGLPRIFNPQKDAKVIEPYLRLDGKLNKRGRPTIAVNPTWNTERIAMQQGVFTLHGSKCFELDRTQASSLLYVPILKEYKKQLLHELQRVGISEMFIFPEPEYVCSHLRRSAGL